MKMNTEKLIKNIIDQIKEAQIKLGFAKETTRLYYPVESLNAMLGIHAKMTKKCWSFWRPQIFIIRDSGHFFFSA